MLLEHRRVPRSTSLLGSTSLRFPKQEGYSSGQGDSFCHAQPLLCICALSACARGINMTSNSVTICVEDEHKQTSDQGMLMNEMITSIFNDLMNALAFLSLMPLQVHENV